MAHALAIFVTLLQIELQEGPLAAFEPVFELVGSLAEGTRIGLPNEQDLAVKFKILRRNIPFKVDLEDPFFLKKASTSPEIVERFFQGGNFRFHKFMNFFLEAVEMAVDNIFIKGTNPKSLIRVTTNNDWKKGKTVCKGRCKRELHKNGFTQCKSCIVCVSQTKSGAVLQMVYLAEGGNQVYSSIDLIPMFPVEEVQTMALTNSVVENMIGPNPPPGWLPFMFKYPKEYQIILELVRSGTGKVISVGLKTMTFLEGRNYHIKPAQEFTDNKFSSDRMRNIYSYIKFLKKVLGFDISSFWIKKELMKREYQAILDSCTTGTEINYSSGVALAKDADDVALVKILSTPAFKSKLESKIDFEESNKWTFINLKK